jgi:hypothetical protein
MVYHCGFTTCFLGNVKYDINQSSSPTTLHPGLGLGLRTRNMYIMMANLLMMFSIQGSHGLTLPSKVLELGQQSRTKVSFYFSVRITTRSDNQKTSLHYLNRENTHVYSDLNSLIDLIYNAGIKLKQIYRSKLKMKTQSDHE